VLPTTTAQLESKQSRSFAQIYAAHARRRLRDSLRTAEWDHRGALTELERVRERTGAPLLQRTRFARPLSLSLKVHADAQTGKGYTRTSAARRLCIAVFGAGDQKESWEDALCAQIGLPGFLADFWQRAFSVEGRELGKARMAA
jgi:hypothetical protein